MKCGAKWRECGSSLQVQGEGGAWGAAILASYIGRKEPLPEYLAEVFKSAKMEVSEPDPDSVAGYDSYLKIFRKGLAVEKGALEVFDA